MRQKKTQGFTLIELIIVMTIIAILSAIAIPSYAAYIRKSRRSDAEAALLTMQLQEEKWRANNSTYTTVLANVGAPATGSSTLTYYTYSISSTTPATAFTVTATAVTGKGQEKDKVGTTTCTLSIDQSGSRLPAVCW
jgi:type IV pilus assembly protein PilE